MLVLHYAACVEKTVDRQRVLSCRHNVLHYWFGAVWERAGLCLPYRRVGWCTGRTATRTVCGEAAYAVFSAPVLFQAVAATTGGGQTVVLR
jgi:hypothetical protein